MRVRRASVCAVQACVPCKHLCSVGCQGTDRLAVLSFTLLARLCASQCACVRECMRVRNLGKKSQQLVHAHHTRHVCTCVAGYSTAELVHGWPVVRQCISHIHF